MAGRDKDTRKKEDRIQAIRGEDVDSDAADLVALLANQVVKDEKKKLRSGIRHKKKGKNDKKKISKYCYRLVAIMYTSTHVHTLYNVHILYNTLTPAHTHTHSS